MSHASILTMMKDEGPRILEWLAYHRLIGFDTIWVYSNDCRDGSDLMLDRLAMMGLCKHLPNVVPAGKKPQPHALTLGQKNSALLATEWLLVMDADEFLHIRTGAGGLEDLLAATPDSTDGIAINWRMMGSSGIAHWSPDPILPQFTHGAPEHFRKGWGIKTLFKPFEDLKLGIHRPTVKGAGRDPALRARLQGMNWVNGSGVAMPPSFMADGWRSSAASVGYGLAELAHFAVQSHEAYLMRGDRGNVNLKAGKYDATYFAMFDRNEDHLPGLSAWAARIADQVAAWLEDYILRRLHSQCVDWHHNRLAELRDTPGFAMRLKELEAAGRVPIDRLETLLFTQPLAPEGKRIVAEMQAQGLPDSQIARAVAQSVKRLEDARDAREAAELRAMGIAPANG